MRTLESLGLIGTLESLSGALSIDEYSELGEVMEALAFVGEPKPEKSGDYLRFRTQMDARVCPICGPLNGRLLPIPSDLVPSGPYYSTSPPVHPNCRCVLEFEIWIIVNPLGVPGGGIPQEIASLSLQGDIQSLIFDKARFSRQEALNWAKSHGYRSYTSRETENKIRVRQFPPEKCRRSQGTKELAPGVQAFLCST